MPDAGAGTRGVEDISAALPSLSLGLQNGAVFVSGVVKSEDGEPSERGGITGCW